MEPNELARVAFNSARMGGYLAVYLWLTTRSLSASVWCKRMLLLAVVCVSIGWLGMVRCGVVFGWLWQKDRVVIGN